MITRHKLLIFDVDGTLADRKTGMIYPPVLAYFHQWRISRRRPAVAIATNQGGVGLRHWMERDGFGDPGRYPTAQSSARHTYYIADKLGIPRQYVYIAYAYQSKRGGWSPMPARTSFPERWRRDWRKPAPGMLWQAMRDTGYTPAETLFIGDRPEDRDAALNAGCAFQWARDFFERSYP